jgi:hypothetical protein
LQISASIRQSAEMKVWCILFLEMAIIFNAIFLRVKYLVWYLEKGLLEPMEKDSYFKRSPIYSHKWALKNRRKASTNEAIRNWLQAIY